jgi:hypothetical protein
MLISAISTLHMANLQSTVYSRLVDTEVCRSVEGAKMEFTQ